MEALTRRQETILTVIDEQLEELEEKLKKVERIIGERDRLRATRRTLLSERGTTSGAGHPGTQLAMEEVVKFLSDSEDGATPQEISEALHVPGATVRSHLNRHKGTRYERDEDGRWHLTEDTEGDEDE